MTDLIYDDLLRLISNLLTKDLLVTNYPKMAKGTEIGRESNPLLTMHC